MSTPRHDNRKSRGARRAFTLVEIIVAIGLLAVVSVLVGTIFASVGETVTTGRQVSNLNRFAARVERVMRRDFENLVRENGFMVIRNEVTNDHSGANPAAVGVPLTATDPGARPRRIDELMFFSRGDFTSRRATLHRDMVARSGVARIYYGHGQRRIPEFRADASDPPPHFEVPRVDDVNADPLARLGVPSSLGQVNPNEFASDWSLLRHATLLVPRAGGLQVLPDSVFGLAPNASDGLEAYNRIADSSRQVALGPAAQSIFRAMTQVSPYDVSARPDSTDLVESGAPGFTIRPDNGFSYLLNGFNENAADDAADETLARPHFASGIVDVAVTDLDEIRTVVTTPWFNLNAISGNPPNFVESAPSGVMPFGYPFPPLDSLQLQRERASYDNTGRRFVGTPIKTFNAGDYFGDAVPAPQTQQLWMLDALPSTPSDPFFPDETGFRVRYEPTPPQVFVDSGGGVLSPEERLERAIRQADQEMLTSSVFLPRCTEFIVEWSLGIIDRRDPENNPNYGQPIWHGLRRFEDGNGNGVWDAGSEQLIADIFGLPGAGAPRHGADDLIDRLDQLDLNEFSIREPVGAWILEDGNEPRYTAQGSIDREMVELVRVDQRFDPTAAGNPEDAVIAEYAFGYQYQDWNEDTDGDDEFDNDEDDRVRPWPWPRLIRVTMRFVDPSDPELERTFQAEFRVPVPRGEI